MSLVYEILDQFGFRILFVENNGIAQELCLVNEKLSYRPVYVAENYSSASNIIRKISDGD